MLEGFSVGIIVAVAQYAGLMYAIGTVLIFAITSIICNVILYFIMKKEKLYEMRETKNPLFSMGATSPLEFDDSVTIVSPLPIASNVKLENNDF